MAQSQEIKNGLIEMTCDALQTRGSVSDVLICADGQVVLVTVTALSFRHIVFQMVASDDFASTSDLNEATEMLVCAYEYAQPRQLTLWDAQAS